MLFVLCQTLCFGQITISNNYFPNAGDSLVTANATGQTVRNITISAATTTAQNWDYSFLRATTPTTPNVDRFRALNAATDTAILKEFPTATLLISDTTGQIAVYRRSTTRFDLLGFFNANLGISPIGIRPIFDPPSLERRAPLTRRGSRATRAANRKPSSANGSNRAGFAPTCSFTPRPGCLAARNCMSRCGCCARSMPRLKDRKSVV